MKENIIRHPRYRYVEYVSDANSITFGLFSNLATGLLHAKQTDSYSEEKANKKLAEQQTQIDELTLQLGDALLGGAM